MTRHTMAMLLPLAALLALPACERSAPEEQPAAPDPSTAGAPDRPSPAPIPTPTDLSPTAAAGGDSIPAAMLGRWGLVPADCEPGRDDAKGLMVVTPRRLEFYESVGTLTDITEAAPARIRAHFGLTGEGMSWQREMLLSLQDGGKALVRRDYGEDAAPQPLRYTKC